MSFCTCCGSEMDGGSEFCPVCGMKVENPDNINEVINVDSIAPQAEEPAAVETPQEEASEVSSEIPQAEVPEVSSETPQAETPEVSPEAPQEEEPVVSPEAPEAEGPEAVETPQAEAPEAGEVSQVEDLVTSQPIVSQYVENRQPVYEQPQTDTEEKRPVMVIIAFVSGILSVLTACCFGLGGIFGIAAIIMSVIAAKQQEKKDGMRTVGLILGIVGTVFAAIILLVIIIMGLLGAAIGMAQ